MRIELTFIIQLCNILATLWFLKNFFWQELLACVFSEQKEREQIALSCSLLEKEIDEKKRSIAVEQAMLTKILQEKLQKLDISTEITPETPHISLLLKNIAPDESIIADGVQKITPLLDKKF